MTFVKPPADGSVKLSGEISGVGIGEAQAEAGGPDLGGLGEAAAKVMAGNPIASVGKGSAFDVGAHVQGIAGGAIGGTAAGIAGIVAGGGMPGGVPNLGAIAAGGLSSAVGQAMGALEAKVENLAGGALGKAAGAVTGGFAGGAINAALQGVIGGAPGGIAPGDLPVFQDIAVTSSDPSKMMKSAIGNAISGIGGGVTQRLGGKNLEVEIGSGDKVEVRQFSIHERLSSLFQVNLVCVSENASIEFDDVVGQAAKFSMAAGKHDRFWSGICNHFEQVRVEPSGLSTYQFSIVPTLWLLTQRKNYRMFQHLSELDIVLKLLKEWEIEPTLRVDKGAYKKRKYRVQYSESDFTFMSRMLEDAGITFYFEQAGEETKLVLSDAPQSNAKRGTPITFVDDTSMVKNVDLEFATSVRMGQRVRPGKITLRDHDYRKPPSFNLMSSASKGLKVEEKLERFHYVPGAFLFGTDSGDATPSADDKGKTRTDEKEAAVLAQKRLDAKRGSARTATFETNAHDLAPGVVMGVSGHAHSALGDGKSFLVVESSLSGTDRGEWSQHCEVRGADMPFRPELVTPRPQVNGVESATVVGPPGEEIHVDEFGRVRVHFHWDRESQMDDNSSCWIHVSQPWGGAGYGGSALPRVGQEVLVDFMGGDPDRPVIVGRVYTALQKTPYKLPENKTQSGLKSNSTGGGGGFNEVMFEDAAGKELVNIQAQRDLNKLVKNDETETTGANRTISVTKNRSADIGQNDSSTVGATYSVTIGSGPTSITMSKDSIVLATSGATVSLGADSISLSAASVAIDATQIAIHATSQVIIDGDDAVLINCTEQPPPDEVEMPSTEDEFIDELISLVPGGRVIELGAKLVLGESAVDGVKKQAAGHARQGANAVQGMLGTGGATSGSGSW